MKRIYKLMVGNEAEQVVCDKLRKDGYIILSRNFQTRQGEIDIIAFRNENVHFIEVKSLREGHSPFNPEASVTQKKMKRILSVSLSFLKRINTVYDVDTDYFKYHYDVAAIVYKEPFKVVSFDYFDDFYTIDSDTVEKALYKK